ncbi:MAG TPA: ATP-binding protein [Tepidisphaeraceae bacterium]
MSLKSLPLRCSLLLLGSPLLMAADHAHHAATPPAGGAGATFQQRYDLFTNFGSYVPRIHCIQNADGTPDWTWIGILLVLNLTVMIGYLKIFRFWRQCYLAEAPGDRNKKLMDLAGIFLLCATCGYGFFVITLVWPAYRLLAVFMVALSFFTWRFAADLSSFQLSFSAKRLHRELHESLKRRNDELEALVTQRTAELERADRFRGEFLANMSHEVRTPMTAILGFADLLADPDLQKDEQTAYIETIRRNGQHMLGLVNDVLDLSKIEAGKLKIERVPCDAVEQAKAVVESLRPKADAAGITLDVHVDPLVPRRVHTDPLRYRQIVTNLVGNAIKFTKRGGVTVSLSTQPRDGQSPVLQIEVRDTGCGIAAKDVPDVFDRFGQAGPGRGQGPIGSGLGLTISRNLARLLGGDITVRSVAGEGSIFCATIDPGEVEAAPPPDTASADDACGNRPLEGLRVLVAEDMADTRTYLKTLLARWGADVTLAENGRVAVERASNGTTFDLILMDVQMPELDGLSATRKLRDHGFAGPIIALTANALVGDRDACLAAGCHEYATKPVNVNGLLATIRRVLPVTAATSA